MSPPGLRPRFWERYPLARLNRAEWEALCDGCGKCCLNKLEDAESGQVVFTRLACRLLDGQTCRCRRYQDRKRFVPECVVLTPGTMADVAWFMPKSCAYRRLYEGRGLAEWHPLVSGDPQSVHKAGRSMRGRTTPEADVPEAAWEDYVIDEPV